MVNFETFWGDLVSTQLFGIHIEYYIPIGMVIKGHFVHNSSNYETARTKNNMYFITVLMVIVKKLKMSEWKQFFFWEEIPRKERKNQKLKMRTTFTVISLWLGLIPLLSLVRSCEFYDPQLPYWSWNQPLKADFDDSFQNLAIKEHMFLDFVRDHTENVDFIYKGMFQRGFWIHFWWERHLASIILKHKLRRRWYAS